MNRSTAVRVGEFSAASDSACLPDTGSERASDIEDFIYLISHDVRGSVRALLELPRWIEEDLHEAGIKVDGSLANSIELMNRHTNRLDRMMVDLLAFSRIGQQQTAQVLDLDIVFDDVLEVVKIPPGFCITRDFGGHKVVMGDRDLTNLITALISNAIKHHDKEVGQIDVSAFRQGSSVILRVMDDGPGIEPTFHERVFAPMTTLRPRDDVEGSGMGLAVVRKVANHYGGAARLVPSTMGRGICVEVQLPVGRAV